MDFDTPISGADGAVERAAALIDPRIADLWSTIWAAGGACVPSDAVGGLLRLAYLTGYQDCLDEPERGRLFRRLGLRVPLKASVPARRGRRSARRGSSDT